MTFEFACLSRNGAFVDGKYVFRHSEPVALESRALIQVLIFIYSHILSVASLTEQVYIYIYLD